MAAIIKVAKERKKKSSDQIKNLNNSLCKIGIETVNVPCVTYVCTLKARENHETKS